MARKGVDQDHARQTLVYLFPPLRPPEGAFNGNWKPEDFEEVK